MLREWLLLERGLSQQEGGFSQFQSQLEQTESKAFIAAVTTAQLKSELRAYFSATSEGVLSQLCLLSSGSRLNAGSCLSFSIT